MSDTQPIRAIDSHTEGEPTRVVYEGGPNLGTGTLTDRLERLRLADEFRRTVILEPRGSDIVVGGLLCEPDDETCAAAVIFFNNAGYLRMCGHGAMGVAVTLGYLGRIEPGRHRLQTPAGVVEIELIDANQVSVHNVPSYRHKSGVEVSVDGYGTVRGDIAWGGNWFFLVENFPVPVVVENLAELSNLSARLRAALEAQNITGADGAEIDHLEFFGPSDSPGVHSRNYVYCPGGAYDRSPCGTGTSAKLACLAADGKLQPGEVWVQESIIGSRFSASYQPGENGRVLPSISGRAFICGETTLIRQPGDPFACGIDLGASA